MGNTPNAGLTIWDAAQATPWLQHNRSLTVIDAFLNYAPIEDRDLAAPPGACANGARYLVKAVATGAWAGHDGEFAVAVGANAVSGWYFVTVAVEGTELWVRDENIKIRHNGAAWVTVTDAITRLQDLLDVTTAGLADGFVMKWDASNGVFYPAPDASGGGGVSRLQDLTDVDLTGLSDGQVLKWDASNGVFYFATDISGGTAGIRTEDEGVLVEAAAAILNFVGGGVIVTTVGGKTIVTIPSGASGVNRLQDLNDVDVSALADGLVMKWDASNGVFYFALDQQGSASSGSAWLQQWSPLLNEGPAANFATLDTRNGHVVLDFDTTTQEAAIFSGVLPSDYASRGITVSIFASLTSATSGTLGWLVSLERNDASGLDTDADSFATAQIVTATTVPGTSGQLLKLSVNISDGANMDGLVPGELFRIKIERDVTNDTAAGDAELLRVTMKEQ